MEPKLLFRNFLQLINVAVIVGLQALSLFLIAYVVGSLAMGFGVRGCPPNEDYFHWFSLTKIFVLSLIGLSSLLLATYYMAKPSVWMQVLNKQIAFAPTDITLPFFSTHPVYVFLDALFFVPAIALFQSGRAETLCRLNFEWAAGWTLLVLAFFFPLFRVFQWFVLGRKIEAMTLKKPWIPVALSSVILLPAAIFLTYTYMERNVLPRLRVPVVNENTFKGGFSKHPEFEGKIVRVQGKLVREIAKCGLFGKDPEKIPYPSGTVLIDMGKRNGQIMIQAKKPSEVDFLDVEAKNKKDKIFEAFGRLSKLPNKEKKLVCGIGKANSEQRGGLALLEIEMPE